MRIPILLLIISLVAPARGGDLRTYTTNHYRIQSDLDRALVDDLARRMDAMYDEYARRLAEFTPERAGKKFDVYLYLNRDDYMRLTNNRMPNSAGVFMPGLALLAGYVGVEGPDGLRRTLQHEAFHQFAESAVGPELPIWVNEGLAEVFEEGIYDGRTFRLGQVAPRRIHLLKAQIESQKLVDFKSMITMTHEQFQANMGDDWVATMQYNQAWAMAHYLIYDEIAPGKPRFCARLIDMLKLIRNGTSGKDAFVQAFSENYAGFQKMFVDWARTLQPTPIASCMEHHDVLATMIASLAESGTQFKDIAGLRAFLVKYYRPMTYTIGEAKYTTEPDVNVYFRDSQNRSMQSNQLFFRPRSSAPVPDLVSRPMDGLQLHTRFFMNGKKIEHETLVEQP